MGSVSKVAGFAALLLTALYIYIYFFFYRYTHTHFLSSDDQISILSSFGDLEPPPLSKTRESRRQPRQRESRRRPAPWLC